MINLIHLKQNRLHHIMPQQLEPRIPKMVHQVLPPPGEEVVDDDDIVPPLQQLVDQVAPHEPGPAGDHDPERLPAEALGDPVRGARAGDGRVGVGLPASDGVGEAEGELGEVGGGGEVEEGGLEEEEGGGDEDTDENEEEALLPEEVAHRAGRAVELAREGRGLGRHRGGGEILVAAVVQARLLGVEFHGGSEGKGGIFFGQGVMLVKESVGRKRLNG